ncbi:ribonuclease HI [Methylobacterium durans]|uniref:ribonuclease H n=1 Tax=Methylobacterium durans TaxID=2202825 RepID=A0A2U8WEG2_9HYPH|nr:ribonuclease HI [Methylobacterium durans]AWN44537.1 ribonuclease HI [Methylobacterium durans]
MRIVVYADGGCDRNSGSGGWGVVISMPEGSREFYGGELATTNNRMELTAAIPALEEFPESAQIEMRCDSQYVVKSMTEWVRGWKAKGWRGAKGLVQNRDLMQRLDELVSQRDVVWTWVRGHNGDALNERADRLAAKGRREALAGPAQPAPAPVPASADAEAERRTTPVQIDFALGLEVSLAAKRAGTTPAAFIEEAVKLVLALGPEEVGRLHAKIKATLASPA